MSGPVRVFLSYAHEDHKWRDDLLNQLGGLRYDDKLVHFDDRQIEPGEEWDARIKAELAAADIVVLLLSPPFVGSGYCHRVELRGCDRAGRGRSGAPGADRLRPCRPRGAAYRFPPMPAAGRAGRSQAPDGLAEPERAARQHCGTHPRAGRGHWRRRGDKRRIAAARAFGGSQPRRRAASGGRARPSGWSGRCVAEPACAAVVYGGPGMGKTTVTLEAACHPDVVGRFGERRCVVALDKAAGPDALVAAVLEALGLRQGGEPWAAIEGALRAGPALVVLDNLETPWQADERGTEEQLARLAGIPGVRLLASIRSGAPPARPRWGVRFELDRLRRPARPGAAARHRGRPAGGRSAAAAGAGGAGRGAARDRAVRGRGGGGRRPGAAVGPVGEGAGRRAAARRGGEQGRPAGEPGGVDPAVARTRRG